MNKRRVTILGGHRPESIGWVMDLYFSERGWSVIQDSCDYGDGDYQIPNLEGAGEALVITLGACKLKEFHKLTWGEMHDLLHANLGLPLLAARDYMRVRGSAGGSVVFIGSYNHDHPLTNGTPYAAAKAGLDMAVRNLAWDHSPMFNFHIVHPSLVPGTPMSDRVEREAAALQGASLEEVRAHALRNQRQHKPLTAQEVAEVVFNLLTHPNHWLSGGSIDMYGGMR